MLNNGWVWLYDEKGRQPISPYSLPKSVDGLIDDLYRSLAYRVREADGYTASPDVPFADFYWANHFRELDVLEIAKDQRRREAGRSVDETPEETKSDWSFCVSVPYNPRCLNETQAERLERFEADAVAIAKSESSKHLPGYNGGGV